MYEAAKPVTLTPEQLAEITRRLVAALAPRAIYLFGSHAYGTPREHSDIDVLVVLPQDDYSTWEVAKLGYTALDGLGLPVELHLTSPTYFERRSALPTGFEAGIRAHGKILYAA